MKNLILLVLAFCNSAFAVETFTLSFQELSSKLGYANYTENKDLSSDQNWSISAYTFNEETDYQDINGYLRFGDDFDLYNQTIESVTKLINDLDSSFKLFPTLPQGLTVFRGTRLNYRNNECFKKGEIVENKSFLSTTLSKHVANHFAFARGDGMGAVLTLIIKSKSQSAILISENDEHEVLLPHGTSFTITKSEVINDECLATGEIAQ